MSAFDTFVRAGGTGIDLPGIINQAQIAKQNDLLLLNAPMVEARAQAQEARLQNQDRRLQAESDREQKGFDTLEGLRQGISLMRFIDSDTPDIQGAIAFVAKDGVTENEQRVIDMLKSGDPAQINALRTGTRGLIETALLVGDIKGAEQPKPMVVSPGSTLVDPNTGETIFAAPQTPTKPDKPITRTRVGPNGEEISYLADAYNGAPIQGTEQISKAAPVTGAETKSFSKMAAENRVKLGLIANAAKLKANAEQHLFDERGAYNNAAAMVPGSKAKIALADVKEALMNMLRTESGAAITDEELSRQVDAMLPNASDFNETATGKWRRIDSKIQSMHSALSGGFTDIPPELQIGPAMQNNKTIINGKTYTQINGEWYEG